MKYVEHADIVYTTRVLQKHARTHARTKTQHEGKRERPDVIKIVPDHV
jgi:hypothetical protein